jgi:hypothetical protein
MSERCKHVEKNGFNCGSYAFNLYKDGIDQGNLCDVHYWQAKALAQQEQEPVAWMLTDKNINSIQVDSIQRLIDRLKHAHHIDLCVRINGQDEWFQADWLKHMVRVTPPQRTWVGLTDEEVEQLAVDAGIVTWVKRVYDDVDKKFYDLPLGEGMEGDGISLKQFANLISTRLKEKNT